MSELGAATKQPLAPDLISAILDADTWEELRDGEFTVCYATDELVLKVWPAKTTPLLTHERGLVAAEADVCRRGREVGFPAPELVRTGCADGRDWLLMSRVPGRSVRDVEVDRELGAALARLHAVEGSSFGYVGRPPLQGAEWPNTFGRIVDALLDDAERFGTQLPFSSDDVRAAVERGRPALARVVRPSLVHFDLWPSNVFAEEGHLSGVIDGERSLYADPLAEWAALALFAAPETRAELLAGYGGLELDEAARARLDLYRLQLCLIILVEEAPRGHDPVQRASVRRRVEEIACAALRFHL